jgi:hypothetical protein
MGKPAPRKGERKMTIEMKTLTLSSLEEAHDMCPIADHPEPKEWPQQSREL